MFDRLLTTARAQARETAQTAAIGVFAIVALAVGISFWTVAGWLFLLTVTTAATLEKLIAAFISGMNAGAKTRS